MDPRFSVPCLAKVMAGKAEFLGKRITGPREVPNLLNFYSKKLSTFDEDQVR
jgi:hypothetical protein